MLHHCGQCSAAFAPDTVRCPQCGTGPDAHHPANEPPVGVPCRWCDGHEDENMPKISRAGGPSNNPNPDREPAPEAVTGDGEVGAAPEPVPAGEVVTVAAGTATAAGSAGTADHDEPAEPADPVGPVRPAGNASKAEWVAYIDAIGGPTLDPDAHTRDELIATADQITSPAEPTAD